MELLDLKIMSHDSEDNTCTLAFMYRDVPVYFKVPNGMTVGELIHHYRMVRTEYIKEHHNPAEVSV